MDILVDAGILLRLVIPSDALHSEVRRSIKILKSRGEHLLTLTQNISEFWNVCTRPATARGGYGFTVDDTSRKVRLIERLISVRPDSELAYQQWKSLLVRDHEVVNKIVERRLRTREQISKNEQQKVHFQPCYSSECLRLPDPCSNYTNIKKCSRLREPRQLGRIQPCDQTKRRKRSHRDSACAAS